MQRPAVFAILSIIVVIGAAGWWYSVDHGKPLDSSVLQQELDSDGLLNQEGDVSVDAEFDGELNALISEMDAAERDSEAELDEMQALP